MLHPLPVCPYGHSGMLDSSSSSLCLGGHPAPAGRWGAQGWLHPLPTQVENFDSLCIPPDCSGDLLWNTHWQLPVLGVPPPVGCHSFCVSYASVYFFPLALETRRMRLPLPPSYVTIKLLSKAQWWQEMTNVNAISAL